MIRRRKIEKKLQIRKEEKAQISVRQWLQESVSRERSNGGSASTRLCIGPYMVASRMVVYRESSKEAEYATVEHIRVLYVSAC